MSLTKSKASALGSIQFELVLTCLFGVLCLLGVLHHEMWRDELQAWNLARDSTSVRNLFANMRTEGHPALWHLCLYAITRVSYNPLLMQLFHAAIATANIFLLATFSPFTQRQKVLAAFGYFSFYEYALISRGYALGVFLIFLFCSVYPWSQQQQNSSKPQNTPDIWLSSLLPFSILSLLANVNLYGMFLSVALSVSLVWPYVVFLYEQLFYRKSRSRDRRPRRESSGQQALKKWPQTLVGIGILGMGWLTCYLQVSRIHVFAYDSPELVSNELVGSRMDVLIDLASRLAITILQVWNSYVPMPPFWQQHFWSRNFLSDLYAIPLPLSLNLLLPLLLSLAMLALVVKSLSRQPKWLAVYGVGTVIMFLFSYFIFGGYLRHHGHLFILLVACFWLSSTDPTDQKNDQGASQNASQSISQSFGWRSRRLQKHLLTSILVCQMLSGVISYTADIAWTFSGSQTAADFLQSQNLDHLDIFGYPYGPASTLSGYLNKPIYYPEHNEFGTFWRDRQVLTLEQMQAVIPDFVKTRQQPVIIATSEALETTAVPGIAIQPLTYVHSQIMGGESFHLYIAATPTAADASTVKTP